MTPPRKVLNCLRHGCNEQLVKAGKLYMLQACILKKCIQKRKQVYRCLALWGGSLVVVDRLWGGNCSQWGGATFKLPIRVFFHILKKTFLTGQIALLYIHSEMKFSPGQFRYTKSLLSTHALINQFHKVVFWIMSLLGPNPLQALQGKQSAHKRTM